MPKTTGYEAAEFQTSRPELDIPDPPVEDGEPLQIVPSDGPTSDFNENEIRARAYALWQEEGEPEGRADIHWAQAEKEIKGGP